MGITMARITPYQRLLSAAREFRRRVVEPKADRVYFLEKDGQIDHNALAIIAHVAERCGRDAVLRYDHDTGRCRIITVERPGDIDYIL